MKNNNLNENNGAERCVFAIGELNAKQKKKKAQKNLKHNQQSLPMLYYNNNNRVAVESVIGCIAFIFIKCEMK